MAYSSLPIPLSLPVAISLSAYISFLFLFLTLSLSHPLSLYVRTAVSSVHALVTPLLSALRDSGSTSHSIAATDSMGGKGALIGRIGE